MEKKCKMSYDLQWKVLADLLIELQKRGEKIPADVMNDLRSAKTIIQVLKADPTHIENISRVDTYMRSVESYAIFTAEKLGIVEEWLKKLKELKKLRTKKEGTQLAALFRVFPEIRVGYESKSRKINYKKILKKP